MKKKVSDYPNLVREWHPELNGDKLPSDFTYGSNKKVWWLCPEGHSYPAIISNRTGRNSGCGECANNLPRPWAKKITIDGVTYENIKLAAKEINISESTIRRFIQKNDASLTITLPANCKTDTRYKNVKKFETGSLEHLRFIAESNGFLSLSDWYGANREERLPSHFSQLIHKYWDADWIHFLESLFPDEKVEFWRLLRLPSTIWESNERIIQYLNWLANELKYKSLDDWYQLSSRKLTANYGDGLYKKYGNLCSILKIYFPNDEIEFWKLGKSSSHLWADKKNHRKFLDALYNSLQYSDLSDWYNCNTQQLHNFGGRSLLKYYPTFADCIIENYPEKIFFPWKFKKTPRKFWSKKSNQKLFLVWMFEQLQISTDYDIYSVGEKHFVEYGGISILNYYDNSPAKCIINLFPEKNLSFAEFDNSSKTQLNLWRFLNSRFPKIEVNYNYKHPGLKFSDSNRKIEIDLYFPRFNLAVEIQGEQHYREAWGGRRGLEEIKERDKEKKFLLLHMGIEFIEMKQVDIPSAWDLLQNYLINEFNNFWKLLNSA